MNTFGKWSIGNFVQLFGNHLACVACSPFVCMFHFLPVKLYASIEGVVI